MGRRSLLDFIQSRLDFCIYQLDQWPEVHFCVRPVFAHSIVLKVISTSPETFACKFEVCGAFPSACRAAKRTLDSSSMLIELSG